MLLDIYEPEVTTLFDPNATLERIADGFQFTEGPVWDARARCLYFSDIPANQQYRYAPGAGVTLFRKPSNFSNGLTLDQQGRLLACEHQARRVARISADGSATVVDRYQGKRLNSPNDLIVARDGSILFTDPHYGLLAGLGGPAEQELPHRGVYRIAPGASEPALLVDDFSAPNGLALSHDESHLYVDDTIEGHLRSFAVGDGWTLTGGDALVVLQGDEPGVPDGLKLDRAGNIYCTGPGGIWLCSPAGLVLGRIRTPEVAANLTWGDDNAQTLYITASTGLYRLPSQVGGQLAWQGDAA